MKRTTTVFLLFMILLTISMPAFSEGNIMSESESQKIKLGDNVTIEDICTFTVKSAQPYNVFMNMPSGDASEFMVITFDFINWMTEPFYMRTQMNASLTYDESFDFEPTYLWANPEGTYYRANKDQKLIVFQMDDSGAITSNGNDVGGGYSNLGVAYYNYTRLYYPEKGVFAHENDIDKPEIHYISIDGSKTVFDPLVQRTMHYVFKVPNIVAKDEGLRVMTISIQGNNYHLRF